MIEKLTGLTWAIATAMAVSPVVAAPASTVAEAELRAGPGYEFAVVEVLSANVTVDVEACMAGHRWCRVVHAGAPAWADRGDLSGHPEIKTRVRADVLHATPDDWAAPSLFTSIGSVGRAAMRGDDVDAITFPDALIAPRLAKAPGTDDRETPRPGWSGLEMRSAPPFHVIDESYLKQPSDPDAGTAGRLGRDIRINR